MFCSRTASKSLRRLQASFGGICRYAAGSFDKAFSEDLTLRSHYDMQRWSMLYDELVKLKTDTEYADPSYTHILNG